ncbi:MAG: hypothetical protein NTW51_05045 [Cyanobacteria bacterium]|nr:hypothetical protein [Cyanobacteriota bacterium]
MSLKKLSLASALGCASLAASAFVAMPAQAACLSTTGEIPTPNNNCVTYDTTSSPTKATLFYNDSNLGNNFWQLTGGTSTIANFSNWEYGSNGTSWTSFNPSFTADTVSGTVQRSTIFTPSTTPSAPAKDPFWIRVTLSNTATLNAQYSINLRTNNDGAVDSRGRLDDTSENSASNLSRNFTRQNDPPAAPAPGPLPLFGAAAAFGYSRKIRKAIRAAG